MKWVLSRILLAVLLIAILAGALAAGTGTVALAEGGGLVGGDNDIFQPDCKYDIMAIRRHAIMGLQAQTLDEKDTMFWRVLEEVSCNP